MSFEALPPLGAPIAASGRLDLARLPVLGWSTFSGPFRSTLPSILDRDDVVFTTSGRAAIALALRALGIGRGDRVLVPTYHCPTMIAPIVAVGAEPVFFPIDATGAPATAALDDHQMQGVRAMIAAHYFGLPQPMAAIRRFCDRHGIALIEDCAHALFGMSDGRPVGRWGDYAIASLTKFLPVVDGGCLVGSRGTDDVPRLGHQPFAFKVKSFANALELGVTHRRVAGLNTLLGGVFTAMAKLRCRRYEPESAECDAEPTDVAGKWLADFAPGSPIGNAASPWARWIAHHAHRERIVATRRRNYALLARLVASIPGVRALRPILPDDAAPYVFPLWVDRPEAVYQEVRRAGVPVFRWDELWPSSPDLAGDFGREWATHVF
ncbi:MAG TPA: DegT/DnrJ/EryC1/StrS family aminotransferase, partial [Casimicrobiaceae bacterium]|nr:DegT/DnrJ/EryC1/StrS family aminotransferase [Casimicrobiaceae bacterium]